MVTAEHPPKGIIIIFLSPIPILFMEQHTGLSQPGSVIIHLASIFFSSKYHSYKKRKKHISFQGFDENVLNPIIQNVGNSVQQGYGFPDYIMPLSCV